MKTPRRICEHEGVPVYYDDTYSGSVISCIGPVKETNYQGLVYLDKITGALTKPDGTPFKPEHVEYETKFFIVGTPDVETALAHILAYQENKSQQEQ